MVDEQKDLTQSELLAAYLDNSLSEKQREDFERLCTQDTYFAQLVEQANFMAMLNDTAEDTPVPKWDKEATFVGESNTRWWQWQGFPVSAFACSVFAVILVVSGFNVQINNGTVIAGFDNSFVSADLEQKIEERVEQIVKNRLTEYQNTNQQLFTQYIDSMQQQQIVSNRQFTEYLLASSRQERKEDFAELIQFMNQQRYDDQVYFTRQLNDLQLDLNNQAGFSLDSVRPISDITMDE